jgi:hypothetical protein
MIHFRLPGEREYDSLFLQKKRRTYLSFSFSNFIMIHKIRASLLSVKKEPATSYYGKIAIIHAFIVIISSSIICNNNKNGFI